MGLKDTPGHVGLKDTPGHVGAEGQDMWGLKDTPRVLKVEEEVRLILTLCRKQFLG